MSALDFVVDTFVGPDGSKYYGTLKNGVPSGLGTCIWPNHCHYDGEWRNGVMHGFGTYVWKNGQRYDGEWKDGRREGIGIKTYVDGSMYDGFWKAGKKHGLGVFRPAPEEPNSRRHSNTHWQSGAGSASGHQKTSEVSTDGAAGTAGGMRHVESSQVLAEAEADAAAAAAAAAAQTAAAVEPAEAAVTVASVEAAEAVVHTPVKPHASPKKRQQAELTSPFAAAAAALNSEPSVVLPPTELTQGRQQWRPSLEVVPHGDSAAAATAATDKHKAVLAATAADAPSTSPTTTMARGAPANSSGDAGAAAAPRKLFVREYDMGQLLREYPLTAEEIKTIFGFLWPKNKVRRRMQKVLRRGPRMQKKLGEVVYKGHYSYSLMLELQLGIRYTVGKALQPRGCISAPSATSLLKRGSFAPRHWWSVTTAMSHTSCVSGGPVKDEPHWGQQRDSSDSSHDWHSDELIEYDFKEKLTVYFPSQGSSTTPAHPSTDFMWRDYCPRVFRRLRSAANIDEADYMLSLAGSQALRQLNSPGKSGSMFLLSDDERFLVKTMRKSEMSVLLDMLPAYAEHMEHYQSSLITRFFGLHKVTPLHGRSVRFVVMANIFVTDLQIHRRYDIKGSTDGRTVGPEARAKAADGDPSIIFKDLDVDMRIVLEQSAHEQLMAQLKADCELLRSVGVMDYSLLLGVHYPQRNMYTRMSLEPVPSASLDGLPNTSPLPVVGGSTAPGSVAASTQGSFVLLDPLANVVETASSAAAAAAGVAAGGAAMNARSTLSDDDVQQPPQQLVRLAAQQQQQQAHLMAQLAKAQQQVSQAEQSASAVGADPPALQEPAGWTSAFNNRSGRSSTEQVPYMPFIDRRRSTSEDVQLPPGVSGYATPPGVGPSGMGPCGTGGGAYPSGAGTAFPISTAGSTAGSNYGDYRGSSVLAGAPSANTSGARNWELWSGAAAQEELTSKVVERMQAMGFSEQRMKDVAELARLKILGGKLKKSATRKEPPSAVLQAMQQQRQEAEGFDGPLGHASAAQLQQPVSPAASAAGAAGSATAPAGHLLVRQQQPLPQHLTSLRGAFTGLGVPFEEDEEVVDTPMALGLPDPKAPAAGTAAAGILGSQQLGINMPALAVPTVAPVGSAVGGSKAAVAAAALDHQKGPDEIILCFGIIDILQDYSTRKVLERTVKGVTHEKSAISVAPPKQYAKRFLEFATSKVFMSEHDYKQHVRQAGISSSGGSGGSALSAGQQSQQLLHLQQQLANGVLQSPPWSLAPIVTHGMQAPASMPSPGANTEEGAAGAALPLSPGLLSAVGQPQLQQEEHPNLQPQDSYPVLPGQLSPEGSQSLAAGNRGDAASEGRMVLKQMGRPAASPVLPDVGSPLLDLLAAPFNTIELMSGEERVSADGVVSRVGEEGVQMEKQCSHMPAAEATDGMLVPAVVVELQGIMPSNPASKQGSLDGKHNLGAAANGQVM